MLDPRASRFWQAALLSGLIDAEALTTCWHAIPPEKRDAPEHIDRRLARQAVHSQALTLWQAQQLLAGRTNGFKVDRYLLLDMIGQGGMGRVYLARDTRLNRRVALKILAPERINNPRAIARFQREARVGAQLQHENLVRVYDFGESNGRYYLVMEYIEGKTIGTLISEQGPMPPSTAARLVRQVALGLGHAHRKGLIHRDVNPYNILVTHDGIAKLADLGLAIDLADSDRVTREGATVGTFDYVSPEQARHSHAADIRSDIYSLGCTLYHMLAGQVPFPSPSLPEKLFAHQALEPAPLGQLVPGLPEGLVQVVRKMMYKSPDERFAAPMQVAQALESYTDELVGVAGRSEPVRSYLRPETDALPPGDASGPTAAVRPPALRSPAAGSPQSDEARTVATPRPTPEPEPAPILGGAGPNGATPATAAAGRGAAGSAPEPPGDAEEPAVPLLTPVDESSGDGSEVALLLDLGPELPLSQGIARSKSPLQAVFPLGSASVFLPGGSGSESSTTDRRTWWLAPSWLWGLLVLAVLAAVLAVIIGLSSAVRSLWDRFTPEENRRPELGSFQDRAGEAGRLRPARDIVVQPANSGHEGEGEGEGEGEDEGEVPYPDLLEAMQAVVGRPSHVILGNSKPLRLAPGRSLNLLSARGPLVVRAAPGVVPVIEVDLVPGRPWLETGMGVSLDLSGLLIRVRYSPGPPGSSLPPPPVIQAKGPTRIQRCAFQVVAGTGPVDSSALAVDGSALTVERCWFEGFARAIQVMAYAGTVARIRQTMFVPESGPAPPPSPGAGWGGWGIEVHLAPGGRPGAARQLLLEQCTVEGTGLLDLVDGPGQSPLQVEVEQCAVKTQTLVAWKPAEPGHRLADRLRWKGHGNLLDVLGRSWIRPVPVPSDPTPELDVVDRDRWSRIVVQESDPIVSKLFYQTVPATRSNSLRPSDFGILLTGSTAAEVGADPEQVGPWGP